MEEINAGVLLTELNLRLNQFVVQSYIHRSQLTTSHHESIHYISQHTIHESSRTLSIPLQLLRVDGAQRDHLPIVPMLHLGRVKHNLLLIALTLRC